MLFYSIFLIEESVELRTLDQERVAIARRGRLISTQKDYKTAKEVGYCWQKKNSYSLSTLQY
ncbi:hypothetical protein H6F76_06205 [Leptolyngbya sp. FACHB-321]|uniref:hypothetical protein n=1 Tax=Leptolyngbya sp. FACHB-321 TaxID=2692807 RepID=UPI001689AF5A|nr:hypothetical protein [Leptolyngbya sp. FACHB-321]MBD2034624.1 hypothetical protein [Leptolyngbya sp. FACHB-321]